MRKAIFMIALIVGASFTTANATENNNETVNNNEVIVTKIVKVNPFCVAIAKGDFDTVKRMIQFGENVNRTSNGKTPLMYAARYNRVKIASLLLESGARLTPKDENGQTAIDYAESAKANDVKKILVAASK